MKGKRKTTMTRNMRAKRMESMSRNEKVESKRDHERKHVTGQTSNI